MHNTKDLRKNLESLKKLLDRNFKFDIKLFEKLDNTNRELISQKEKLEQEKKNYLNLMTNLTMLSQKKYPKKFQKLLVNK